MDSSFENSQFNAQNNAFHVNSNPEVAFAKDGLLFDLPTGDSLKQQNGNGEDHQENDNHLAEDRLKNDWFPNGKSAASCNNAIFDDEEDEDLGPETDVDAIDDMHTSPSMEAARALAEGRPASAEFAVDDVDMVQQHELIKDEEDADEIRRPVREETPTPPADQGIEITGGLVDNVAESGEESEDEWNYIKGEQKSETAADEQSSKQSGPIPIDLPLDTEINNSDDMNSPLNPDAPPFVPVTPNHRASPDISAIPARLLPDEVVSQSPQKPVPMDDIDIPDPNEFENEVSTRLADLGNAEKEYFNGHNDDSALSSQENLKETLHGNEKQLSDYTDDDVNDAPVNSTNIVDPAEFDRVQKDTTDFCDVQVAYSQHNNPTFDDEGIDEELFERLKNKERDPMSMSFYQEKDEDTCETGHNPFDLNAVQTLPNDSFEEYPDDQPQPDNSLYGINPFTANQPDVTTNEINAAISHIDNIVTREGGLFESAEFNKSENIPGDIGIPEAFENAVSPVSDNLSQLTEPSEHEIENENKPQDIIEPEITYKPEENVCLIPTKEDNFIESFDSKLESQAFETDIQSNELDCRSPDLIAQSPEMGIPTMSPVPVAQSPELAIQSPELIARSPEPIPQSPELIAQSPEVPDYHSESITHPLSPQTQSPYHNAASPFPEAQSPIMDNFPASDIQECMIPNAQSPILDIQSTILESKQPILDCHSPQPDIIPSSFTEFSDNTSNFASDMLQQTSECILPDETIKSHVDIDDFMTSNVSEVQEAFIEQKQVEGDLFTQMENHSCEIIESNVVENVLKTPGEFLTNEICKPISDDLIEKSFSPFTESDVSKIESNEQITTNMLDDFISKPLETTVSSDCFKIDQPTMQSEPIGISEKSIEQNILEDFSAKIDEPITNQKESESAMDLVTPIGIAAVTGAAAVAVSSVVASTTAAEDKKPKSKPTTPAVKKTTTTTKSATSPTKPAVPLNKSATSPTKTAASPTKSAVSPTKSAASPIKAATPRVSAAKKPTTPVTKSAPATTKPSAATAAAKPKTLSATSPTKPAAKPLGATSAAPKPKPISTTLKTTTTSVTEKKPLTNGDVKKEVIKKTTTTTTTIKSTTATKPAATGTATKTTTTTTSRVSLTGTARPTTAPARTVAGSKPAPTKPATATSAAPKPRPAPTPATRTVTKPTSATTTKPITDKMTKDSTNKQISASRPTPAPRTGIAPKVSDAKSGTKTVSKTTTTATKTTNPPPIKRPSSMTSKTAVSKTTKTTTKVVTKEVAVEKQNGTLEKSEKEETILQDGTHVNGTPLISDISAKEDLAQLIDDLNPCYSY